MVMPLPGSGPLTLPAAAAESPVEEQVDNRCPSSAPPIITYVQSILVLVCAILYEWIPAVMRRIGDVLFAPNDVEARWMGWEIASTHNGLGRRYRDPLFDKLTQCPRCEGAGISEGIPCLPCLGTGRITIGAASS